MTGKIRRNSKLSDRLRELREGDHHPWYIVLLVSCSPAELTSSSDVRCKYQWLVEQNQYTHPNKISLYLFKSIVQHYFFLVNLSLTYYTNCPIDGGKLNMLKKT